MHSSTLPHCSVLLLAGGRGQRVGNQDKGLIEWRGRPLIAHMHALVRPLTDDLIISCNRNQDDYAAFADQLVSDPDNEFPGPLAGLLSAAKTARHSHLLVLPCDAPLVDAALIQTLRSASAVHPQRPVMLRQGAFWQPLISMFPKQLTYALQQAWDAGERSPRRVYLAAGALAVECAADDIRLANLNTPELLKQHGGFADG